MESKWGTLGRLLHCATEFAGDRRFYHTNRQRGHHLAETDNDAQASEKFAE